MNKEEILAYLSSHGIGYELTEHKAVFTMEELEDVNLPYPLQDAKNLFVRDDKKRNYYLISVKGDRRVDLKEFRQKNGTRSLSFASPEDLFDITGLTPGSVTPLGLLNDKKLKAEFYLDASFLEAPGIIGCHPCDNTSTVWIKTEDLIHLIEEHGNIVHLTDF